MKSKLYGTTSAEFADPLSDVGLCHWQWGDLAGGEQLTRRAIELKRKLSVGQQDLASSIGNLGLILWEEGRLDEAEVPLKESLERIRALSLPPYYAGLCCMNLGLVQREMGHVEEAEALFQQAMRSIPNGHPYAKLNLAHLASTLRRRAALSDNTGVMETGLREALQLRPDDMFTSDALGAVYAQPSLTLLESPANAGGPWRFTSVQPPAAWAAPTFSDTAWTLAEKVTGRRTYAPYSPRIDRSVLFHTNLWLRREFDLLAAPTGRVVLRLNRCHDAEVYINGVLAGPSADWTDTAVLLPCSVAGKAALKPGRNVLALHCSDADGGAVVGLCIYQTQDSELGRQQLLQVFNQLVDQGPRRSEAYAGRAHVNARSGRWAEAVADLNRAIAVAPEVAAYWRELASLLLQAGDEAGYERHRREALRQFEDPQNPTAASQVAALALLRPLKDSQPDAAAKLADYGATAIHADKGLVSRQLAKALSDYRQSKLSSAIDWAGKAWAAALNPDLVGWNHERQRNRTAAACLIQAMAKYRSGRAADAQRLLSQATEIVHFQMPQLESGDIGREWSEWLVAHILLQEATDLIAAQTPTQQTK